MAEEAVRGESSSSAANGNGSPSDKPKRKRSRGGCYTCRRRKKLCDNARPTCGSCQRLEIPCVFPKLYRNKDGTLAPSPQPNGRGKKLPADDDEADEEQEQEQDPEPETETDAAEVTPEDPLRMDEVMAEGIDWNQITDSLGFPMGNLSVPIPVPEPMMDMRGGIPEPMQPWDSFATPLDFGAAPLPDLTPVPVAMPDLPGPSNYTPAMDVHQSNAAASSSAMPQFNWWVPTPLGQPGHSVLSANMTEEQPPEEQTALTLVNNPGMRAPGLDGLNPTITDNAPLLLDYFVNSFSKIISVIGPADALLQHLLPLASSSPLVMRGLVGWSAAHLSVLGEPFASIAKTNTAFIERQLRTYERSNIDQREREEALMAMLMLGGAELCEGDVKGWNSRLPTMRKMLMSATDTEAQLSREWKGMAFNAIYHDVLSAVATTRNMALPIEQYQKLLDKSTDPDTYMGVALQVFALLAEVASIASRVSEAQKTCASDKISQLVRLHAESNAVLERLNNVEPPRACYVPDKMHMVFAFHAYRSAAELFMRQTVLRAAPTDIRTQVLVERTLLHLRLVIDTPSESQMLLPLFVVGVDTVGVDPRAEIVELFNRFNARVLTGNIKTVHNLLQEVWKRNPDGDRWVDWRQIADEEEQAVSFG